MNTVLVRVEGTVRGPFETNLAVDDTLTITVNDQVVTVKVLGFEDGYRAAYNRIFVGDSTATVTKGEKK